MKNTGMGVVVGGLFLPILGGAGCVGSVADLAQPTGVAGEVASKAQQVVDEIGGATGFGGMLFEGYGDHLLWPMGFRDEGDLAGADELMIVRFQNDTDEPCRFDLVYISSSDGVDEQVLMVDVAPRQTELVELPCAEIVGLGSLTDSGETAAVLGDAVALPNTWCVPGLLHADYACGDQYRFVVGPDVDDLDGDGNTTEPVVLTEALELHMGVGGMMGHGSMMGFTVRR